MSKITERRLGHKQTIPATVNLDGVTFPYLDQAASAIVDDFVRKEVLMIVENMGVARGNLIWLDRLHAELESLRPFASDLFDFFGKSE